jgi:hypothetical protein
VSKLIGDFERRAPVAPYPDWNPLLKDLKQLHSLWLTKAEAPAEDKKWIRGVLFGIQTAWNRIAEELAKPNPTIAEIIADWRQHLSSREQAAGQEVVEGVDYGIELVMSAYSDSSSARFRMSRLPRVPRVALTVIRPKKPHKTVESLRPQLSFGG